MPAARMVWRLERVHTPDDGCTSLDMRLDRSVLQQAVGDVGDCLAETNQGDVVLQGNGVAGFVQR